MNLIDEAVIIEIFGIRMYAFGLYVAVGALFAVIIMLIAAKTHSLKKGTVPLTVVCAMVCGMLFSRISFCLLNRELGQMTPLSFWPQLNGGGWSMFGLIGGILLGGYISARTMKEKNGEILDMLCLAMLPLIAAERIGENRIDDFDISRPIDSKILANSFLAVGTDEPCLATYYIAAAVAVFLFVYLAYYYTRQKSAGNLTIAFLILFGASSIVTESLRYDRFLSVSFVGLQQVAAALMLAIGVVLSIKRNKRVKHGTAAAAIISLLLMVGLVIGLEFALDRTTWNKILIYVGMIASVAVPAGFGLKMLSAGKGNEDL